MREYIIKVMSDKPLSEIASGETIIAIAKTSGDCDELIRCKDCRYFETNHWEKVNEIPLIVAHEICTRWGEGCKTAEDGYCFMAERK